MDDDIVIISTTKTNTSSKSNKKEVQGENSPSDEFNIVITDISQENRYSNKNIDHMRLSQNTKEMNKLTTETNTANLQASPNSEIQTPSFPEEIYTKSYNFDETHPIPNEEIKKEASLPNEMNNSSNKDNTGMTERESTGYFSYFKNLFTKSSTQTSPDCLPTDDERTPKSKRSKHSTDKNPRTTISDKELAINDSLNTESKVSTKMNTSNTSIFKEEQIPTKDMVTDEREVSIDDQVNMYYTEFSSGNGPLNLMSSLLGKNTINESVEIPDTQFSEASLDESNNDVLDTETTKQETEKNEETPTKNKENVNKIEIILKNRTQSTTFYLLETENLKSIFDSLVLGDKKIFFGEFVISKFSTPKILQMSNTEANILHVKNPKIEQNGLLLKINVSSSKTLEQIFRETVKLKDIFDYVKEQGIFGKTKLVFNGSILKDDDLMDLDDGYCIDAV